MGVITGKIVDKVMINDKMITRFLLLLNIHSIILMQLLNMEIVCAVCIQPFSPLVRTFVAALSSVVYIANKMDPDQTASK